MDSETLEQAQPSTTSNDYAFWACIVLFITALSGWRCWESFDAPGDPYWFYFFATLGFGLFFCHLVAAARSSSRAATKTDSEVSA